MGCCVLMNARLKSFLEKLKRAAKMEDAPKPVRRLVVGVVGTTVMMIGVALIVLPGPAFIVIPVGLAILATEFAWAKRYMDKGREAFKKTKNKFSKQKEAHLITARE